MEQKLLNHFPMWHYDLMAHPDNYYLVLSDDMDSFYACRYLHKKTGVEIGGFYDFEKGLFLTNKVENSHKSPIYVDVAVVQDGIMTFDNHRSIYQNHMSINPNVLTDRHDGKTYHSKYCGSTLMLVVALYGGVEEMTEIEKGIICALDSFYVGYYKEKYRNININWLNILGIKNDLLPILEKHSENDFIDLIADYQLNEKIYINKYGKLFTYDDILPKDTFELIMPTAKRYMSKFDINNKTISDRSIFVAAECYNGKYVINSLV